MKTILYKPDTLLKVISAFKRGDIIALPTDTVFGLACIYDNRQAINNIKIAKKRDINKSLPMMCNNLTMVKKYACVNKIEEKLIQQFSPGPFTIILNSKDIPAYVNDNKDTIAIRIPDDQYLLEIIGQLNQPLLVTSANISNYPSLKKWEDVYAVLKDKINGIVMQDAKSEIASTIVDARNGIKILRQGVISETIIRGIYERDQAE